MPTRFAVPVIDPRALAGHDPSAPVIALAGGTMGTTWRLLAATRDDPAAMRAAAEARLAALMAQMSHWSPTSVLARFNALPGESWATLPPDFARVMACALDVAAGSGGTFDPAAGRLVDLWGYGPPGPQPVPSAEDLLAAVRDGDWRRLAWRAPALRQPGGLRLDLSGIAKGFAADALAAVGGPHCLAEVGGELAGRGLRPDGDPWWVELEPVPGAPDLPPLRVALHGLGVATSGSYVRGAHNLDPRTGRPATGVLAVSVVAGSAMLADAWSTALLVLGAEGRAVATREALAVRIVAADGEWLSPALQAMLD